MPVLATPERLLLRLHELAEGRREVGLAENFAGFGRFARLAGVWQHHGARVLPLFEPALVSLDRIRGLLLDGITVRHADRRLEHLPQAERAILGEHDHESAGGAGGDGREWAILRWEAHPLGPIEVGGRSRRRHAERVDGDDLLGAGIVDQRLRFAAPGEHVPHRGDGRQHGARRIDRVAAFLEDHGAGFGAEWLAGDRDPVPAVERRFLGTLGRKHCRQQQERDQQAAMDGHRGLREEIVRKLCYPDARGHRSPHTLGAHSHERDRQLSPAAVPGRLALHR